MGMTTERTVRFSVPPEGYVYYSPEPGIWVLEHRFVMETALGRKLTANEVVHHINHDKADNHPENLLVMTRGEHTALHNEIKPRSRNPMDRESLKEYYRERYEAFKRET